MNNDLIITREKADEYFPFVTLCIEGDNVAALDPYKKYDYEGDGSDYIELYELPCEEIGNVKRGRKNKIPNWKTETLTDILVRRAKEITEDIDAMNRVCKALNYNCRIEIIDSEICVIKERREET